MQVQWISQFKDIYVSRVYYGFNIKYFKNIAKINIFNLLSLENPPQPIILFPKYIILLLIQKNSCSIIDKCNIK